MQVTETLNEGLKRSYKLLLTAQELDDKVTRKLAEAQPEVAMKGFRKGKVPMALLKKQFGQRLMGEVMQESIDGAMSEHFEASGDRPAMQPEVKMTNEDWKEGDDVEVALTYEALPEVPEVDLKSISLERLVVKPDDAAIDEALGNLAETAQDFKPRTKTAKAKDGDQVVFDFVGKVGGEAFEGGTAEDVELTIGEGRFIPGFEEQLAGAAPGEERIVTVTFPEAYPAENLAGKEAAFDVTVKEVAAPQDVTVDDALAERLGLENLDALKSAVRGEMQKAYESASRSKVKRALLDALDERFRFDLPQKLVDTEFDTIWKQVVADMERSGQSFDPEAAEDAEGSEAKARTEYRRIAERRVRLGLLLSQIGTEAEVAVTDDEVQRALGEQMRQFPGQEREVLEFYRENPQALGSLRAPIFEDKVVDYILELVKVTDKPVSKDELMAEPDEDHDHHHHDHEHDHHGHDH